MRKLCWKHTDLDVSLHQTGKDLFIVTYGKQETLFLNYAEAAHELGESIMHALACEGKLDNREKGER